MMEENKNLVDEIKKYFDEKTEETKRHFDVALEHMDERLDAIIESQKITDAKVDSLETKVDSLETKVDSLIEDMDFVKSTLVEHKDRFKETDEALEKKAEKNDFLAQESRISALEKVPLM